MDHNISFKEKRQYFRRKLDKNSYSNFDPVCHTKIIRNLPSRKMVSYDGVSCRARDTPKSTRTIFTFRLNDILVGLKSRNWTLTWQSMLPSEKNVKQTHLHKWIGQQDLKQHNYNVYGSMERKRNSNTINGSPICKSYPVWTGLCGLFTLSDRLYNKI
jgi:hypothetical protein